MFDMSLTFDDIEIMQRVIQRGIDSRLEGFTRKSSFKFERSQGTKGILRLQCKIHSSEMSILLRRLLEDDTEEAEMLADSIVSVEYGYEL